MAVDPSIDMDVQTGADVSGWPHVLNCIQDFFTTNFGERVMREWYGTAVPRFLGENMNTQTIVPFFAAIASAIEQWEPRFRLTRVTPQSVGRDGRLVVVMEGEYRPRALLGDFTPEGARRVTISGGSGSATEVTNGN
jgi:phage baseplate assembly protein W